MQRHTIFHFGPDERAAFIAILRYYRDHSSATTTDKAEYDEILRKFEDIGGSFLTDLEMYTLAVALNATRLKLQEKLK